MVTISRNLWVSSRSLLCHPQKLGFNKPRLQQELDSNKNNCVENSRRLADKLKEVSNVSSFNVASFGWSDLTV